MPRGQTRRIALVTVVRRRWPAWDAEEVDRAIRDGEIVVEGRVLVNPAALVRPEGSVRHAPPARLAGHKKLGWAIGYFGVAPAGRVALDVGASTGGFTTAWLGAGATRVYAVDAGHGQLLGSLRADPRVTNLERTNVAELSGVLVPEPIGLVSVDVSYLALAAAVAQVAGLDLAPRADLLGLVKPMFELRLATIPTDRARLAEACDRAVLGVTAAGWDVLGAEECPVRGGRGAVEFFIHARWSAARPPSTPSRG